MITGRVEIHSQFSVLQIIMFCLKGKISNTCQINMKKYLLSIFIMGRVTIHYFLKFHPSVICGSVDTRDPLTCKALNSLESRK